MKRPITKIECALAKVNAEIKSQTDQNNKYSRGLAYEGWQGGYLSALQDVLLVLHDITPNRRQYWED